MIKLSLTLYVTGRTIRSDTAIENLQTVLSEMNPNRFELTIIDVLENPQAAEDEFILATPTLVKRNPKPKVKIIGDLSDTQVLVDSLDLSRRRAH